MDVLSASFRDDKIAWYENTDKGHLVAKKQLPHKPMVHYLYMQLISMAMVI